MPIPSHACTYSANAVFRRFLFVPVGVASFAAAIHLAARFELLPTPVPSDLDRTILSAKAELAASGPPTDLVLSGDSSCMMNVDAARLARNLGKSVVNLGTLSHLDLRSHAELLGHRLAKQPLPSTVVLLLHPSSLRRGSSEPHLEKFLSSALAGDSRGMATSPRSVAEAALALVSLRERTAQALVPGVLRGDFATRYGTTWQIRRLLSRQGGTLADPTRFDSESSRGWYEFSPIDSLEEACRAYRSTLPRGISLYVGLAPIPTSLAPVDHPAKARNLVQVLVKWLEPAEALDGLPAVLPEGHFSTTAHLEENRVEAYTRTLATALGKTAANPP